MKIPIIRADEPMQVKPVTATTKGAGRVWDAVGQLSGQVQDIFLDIENNKRKVQDALDLQRGIDEFRTRVSDYIIKTQQEPDKTNYAEKLKQESLNIQNDILSRTKSPRLQEAFKVKLGDMSTDYYIKGKYYENDWFVSTKTGEAEESLYKLAQRAGGAITDLDREKIRAEGKRLIDTLTGTIYNPEQATKKKIALDEVIEKERLKAVAEQLKNTIAKADMEIFQYPHKADEILQKEGYRDIPEDKKVSLLNKGIIRADKIDKQTDKDTKKAQEEKTYEISAKIVRGQYALDEILNLADRREITREQFEHLTNLHRQREERSLKATDESDPEEFKRVSLDVHSSDPKTSEYQIQINPKLSTKDQIALLDRLRTQKEHIRTKREQLDFRRHQQAEQIGFSGLTTTSPFEKLDPKSQELKTLYLEELTRRSSAMDGKEDPLAVKDEILPQYQRVLLDSDRTAAENYKKLLRFGSAAELEEAYKARMITPGEYESQKRIFIQYQQALKNIEAIELQMQQTPKRKR